MKLNKTVLLIALLILSKVGTLEANNFDSQKFTEIGNSLFEIVYNYTINPDTLDLDKIDSQNKSKLEVYTTILQGNNSVSKFWDYNLFKRDSIILKGNQELTADEISNLDYLYNYKIKHLFVPVVFKNYPDNHLTVTDEIAPNDYLYKEKKPGFDWQLEEETLTVCGYLCYKAKGNYGGREWTAWYTPEIAASDGPWKLFGLPGLILKAQDADELHTFEAIVVRQSDHSLYLEKSALRLSIDRKTFIKNKNKYESNPSPGNSIPIDQISSMSIIGKGEAAIVLINDRRTTMNRVTTYTPLELE